MGLRDGGGWGQGRFLGRLWEEAPTIQLYNTMFKSTNTMYKIHMRIEIQVQMQCTQYVNTNRSASTFTVEVGARD